MNCKDIERLTGLGNISMEVDGGVVSVFSNGEPVPESVRRWVVACEQSGEILPYDAVEVFPAVQAGLSGLGISVTSPDELRGKMPEALTAFNAAYENSTTQDEKNALFRNALNLLAAYTAVIGRSY
jgi:hypothetical protein